MNEVEHRIRLVCTGLEKVSFERDDDINIVVVVILLIEIDTRESFARVASFSSNGFCQFCLISLPKMCCLDFKITDERFAQTFRSKTIFWNFIAIAVIVTQAEKSFGANVNGLKLTLFEHDKSIDSVGTINSERIYLSCLPSNSSIRCIWWIQ